MFPSSQPLAGIGVTNSGREQAEAKGQHDDIQHGFLLAARFSSARSCPGCGKPDCDESIADRIGESVLPVFSGREVPLAA
jgi:hypothetical protein